MKRFHVHVHVADLEKSIAFYAKLFGAEPVRVEADYAKWMLEDPRINFAISTHGGEPGVDHLGVQTDSEAELADLKERSRAAELTLLDEGEANCCYSRSDKYWLTDPQGIAWEQFHTLASIPVFGDSRSSQTAKALCCAPSTSSGKRVQVEIKAGKASCC